MTSLFEERRRARPLRSRQVWQRLEYVLLAVGVICIAVFAWNFAETRIAESWGEYQLLAELRREQPDVAGYVRYLFGGDDTPVPSADEDAYRDLARPEKRARRPVPASGLIGRIEIPRVEVSAIVREGVDSKTLRRSAGHVPGTALPGDDGNVAVAAHRDTLFRGVRNIRENDVIRLTAHDGVREYVVRDMSVVDPTDVHVLEPRRRRELTLITCYPFNYIGHAPKRFIVRAEEVSHTAEAPATFGVALAETPPPAKAAAARKAAPPSRRSSAHRRPRAPLGFAGESR